MDEFENVYSFHAQNQLSNSFDYIIKTVNSDRVRLGSERLSEEMVNFLKGQFGQTPIAKIATIIDDEDTIKKEILSYSESEEMRKLEAQHEVEKGKIGYEIMRNKSTQIVDIFSSSYGDKLSKEGLYGQFLHIINMANAKRALFGFSDIDDISKEYLAHQVGKIPIMQIASSNRSYNDIKHACDEYINNTDEEQVHKDVENELAWADIGYKLSLGPMSPVISTAPKIEER